MMKEMRAGLKTMTWAWQWVSKVRDPVMWYSLLACWHCSGFPRPHTQENAVESFLPESPKRVCRQNEPCSTISHSQGGKRSGQMRNKSTL